MAQKREYWIDQNRYYYALLARLLRFLIEPAKRVLSIRCSTGELLAAVHPSSGVGVEISEEMAEVAKQRHPEFTYETAFPDTDEFQRCFEDSGQTFDYILVGEVDDTVDVQRALQNLRPLCERHTRLIITTYNHLWEPLVTLAEFLGMKVPRLEQNWLSSGDIGTLLSLSGYELVGRRHVVLCPKYIPLLSTFLNGFCARLPGVNRLCMTVVHVARTVPAVRRREDVTVSVVIPCKDERGNIEDAVRRITINARMLDEIVLPKN